MGIGTSLGAYFESDFHHQAGIEDHSHDDSVITPEGLEDNRQKEKTGEDILGGTEIAKKNTMPFPDNRNPDSDFNSRFGNLPPSGILNDLKPTDQVPPLVRRINDVININPMNDTENGIIPLLGSPERVSKAALLYKDKITEAENHGIALDKIMRDNPKEFSWSDVKDGFTTTYGRFISREEAMDIASKADQLKPGPVGGLGISKGDSFKPTQLLSEDLKPFINGPLGPTNAHRF